MINMKEFTAKLDKLVPTAIQKTMEAEMHRLEEDGAASWIDIMNLQERARVLTLKDVISATHKWSKVSELDSTGYQIEAFWCPTCGLRASAFEHTNAMSIISKVVDKLPTYTTHNQYLMFTCEQVQVLKHSSLEYCGDCGVPYQGKSSHCHRMIDY
jgi:hypothetical protein